LLIQIFIVFVEASVYSEISDSKDWSSLIADFRTPLGLIRVDGDWGMKHAFHFLLSAAFLFLCSLGVAFGATEVGGTVYLDNVKGSDQFDGSSSSPGAYGVGPVASIAHASDILKQCGKLVIANTGVPYRGTLLLMGKGGTPETPLIVEGNNATLEGLVLAKPTDWTVEKDGTLSMRWPGPEVGFLVVTNGAPPVFAGSLQDLKPGEVYYNKSQSGPHPGYYRLPEGKRIEDLKLEVDTGGYGSGVQIIGASNIIVRHLKCRYFEKDGFDLQSQCEGVRFEHIEAYLNGDRGFNCNATASCNVIDGNFHENDSGIGGIAFSRSCFFGVKVVRNRSYGVLFQGGEHSIVNGLIADNPTSITLEQISGTEVLPGLSFDPYSSCRLCLRNACVQGGDFGLRISGGSSASVDYCVFRDQPTSLIVADAQSRLHMTNSIVAPQRTAISFPTGAYWGDYNCWTKGDAEMNGVIDNITDDRIQPAMERHSIVADPLFSSKEGPDVQSNSPVRGKAFVDPSDLPWIKNSGFLDPKYPPEQYPLLYPDLFPDLGCQISH
jgi:hypothetical protein